MSTLTAENFNNALKWLKKDERFYHTRVISLLENLRDQVAANPLVRITLTDLSPAENEGVLRDALINMGWTPPPPEPKKYMLTYKPSVAFDFGWIPYPHPVTKEEFGGLITATCTVTGKTATYTIHQIQLEEVNS